MLRLEQTAVTGREDKQGLPPHLAALSTFYAALNGRNLELMASNWLQSNEAAMDNPLGGIKRGWEEIKSVYQRLFASPSEYWFEFYDFTLHLDGNVFYVVGRERGEFKTVGTVLSMAIRTTRIFTHRDGRWQQVHHHGSIDDPDLLARYQAAVRPGIDK
ncbi:nuclear transport factor 2 family protein [Geomonas subterranea]|uniref:Nuclear transport factor 2 family protein n=1 Tax=Geomonas subterranea TaxID=2847989 RepID=A0ABX8LHK8_9BACT|nr:nuclear transport factor 2 family protein [Geomonas subterranea]QXE91228.1 nuclear transport factor 2 family protein [Geomonas subterranea]QXM10685.1 nuclear transport factor 2 family protein [Geomonas subterranea]